MRPMRYPGFYPLLVTGNHVDESLSVNDCELIAEALTKLSAEQVGATTYARTAALAEIFRTAPNDRHR